MFVWINGRINKRVILNQNSKVIKWLMRLEQTFRTIELALATKKIIQKMLFTEMKQQQSFAPGETGKQPLKKLQQV